MANVDILAFGAHQDDVEVGLGGSLLKWIKKGKSIATISLTRNEMNSRATPEIIEKEAQRASETIGVHYADTLDLGDTKIENSIQNRQIIANCIRKYQPEIVLSPYPYDLHNDHTITGQLVSQSNLYSRLKKFESTYEPHGAQLFLHYFLQLQNCVQPTLVNDISDEFSDKIGAIKSFESQFKKNAGDYGIKTVGISDFMFHIESRDRYFGSLINVKYGEPLYSERPLNTDIISSLL